MTMRRYTFIVSTLLGLVGSATSYAYDYPPPRFPYQDQALRLQSASFQNTQPNFGLTPPRFIETAPTQSPSIWQRINQHYQLGDHALNPRVQPFIRQYTASPSALNQLVLQASQYLHVIIEEVERRGIPAEIALLPLVESGFTPAAASRAGAAGLWQFMPQTGNTYGLIRNQAYDGRLDSFASTGAALNYLQSLNREFKGDWMLTLAAYNAGPNRIHMATGPLRRVGQRISYWNLALPKETAEYVPRLLAFKEIISHPERYGIRLPYVPNAPLLAQMRIDKPVDLRQAALQAGLPASTLTELNPYFRLGITTPEYSNRIILPRHRAADLVQIIHIMPASHQRIAMTYPNRSLQR
jgi:membrane-bound lytic murein transglycosylase D